MHKMARTAIDARGVCKSFGPIRVLRGLDLSVAEGERYVLFGSNGTGKTTLIRVLSGLLRPEAGTVRLLGGEVGPRSLQNRTRIGLMSHETFLYKDLTALENLEFYGRLYSVEHAGHRAKRLLKQVRLYHRAYDRVGSLSRGMMQRLSLARALLHDPELLLMDEPYTGLDVRGQSMLGRLLPELSESGKTVFMITHDLERGLDIASRMGVLSKGKIALEAAAAERDQFSRRYRELVRGESG